MEKILKTSVAATFLIAAAGCTQAETGVSTPARTQKNGSKVSGQSKSAGKMITKLMAMERRDSHGSIVGLNDVGLWCKRGEKGPYTGIVAGYYKAMDGKEPIMASMREYKNGVQVGTETSWYENGNKRIELAYKNGESVTMKQWGVDGKEFK